MGSMTLLTLASWICFGTGYLCERPDAAIIQRAYEQESAAGSTLHDRGLRVLGATCGPTEARDYLCEVTFTSSTDPDEHLYFDVIRIARVEAGWQLASGLCKR